MRKNEGVSSGRFIVLYKSVLRLYRVYFTHADKGAGAQGTLLASRGPEARRAAKNVNLKEVESRWGEEFGSERAEMLREIVKAVWSDYEYLRQRRLILPGAKI